MENMFCYQCEQTAKGTGCTVSGVCGKKPDVAREQDELTCEMVALAKAVQSVGMEKAAAIDLIVEGLFTTITNVNFDEAAIACLTRKVRETREKLVAVL